MNAALGMDYLHALAARSLGVSDSIRPRLPSLFEPVNTARPVDLETLDARPRARRIEAEAGPTCRPADMLRSDAAAESVRPRVFGDPFAEHSRRPRNNARPAVSEHEVLTHDRLEDSVAQRPAANTAQPRAQPDRGRERQRAVRAGVASSEPDTGGPDPAPVPGDRRWASLGSSPAERDSTSARIAPAEERPTSQRRVDANDAGARRATRTLPLPRSPADPVRAISRRTIMPVSSPTAATLSSKETVVQVTIGRVEVRAVAPPAARKPVPALPVMSLDEYLRRRSGGGAP